MKNLITKKLALLAIVLFASMGSASGYEISFEFNYENVAGVNIYVDDGDESYYDGFASNQSLTYSNTADVQLQNLYFNNQIYFLSKIWVDGADVTETFNSGGYTIQHDGNNHTVRIELTKKASKTIHVTISHPEAVFLNFSSDDFWGSTNVTSDVEVPEGQGLWVGWQYTNLAYPIQSITVDGADVTEAFLQDQGHWFENVTADHTIAIVLKEQPSNTISVSFTHSWNADVRFVDGETVVYNYTTGAATGHDIKMYIEPHMGFALKQVMLNDGQGGSTDITNTLKTQGYYLFSHLNDNYTVMVELEEAAMYKVHVYNNSTEGNVALVTYFSDPDSGTYWSVKDPEMGNSFNAGTNIRIKAWPNENSQEVYTLVVDSEEKIVEFRENGYVEISNLSADHNIYINYRAKPALTVTFDDSKGYVELSDYGQVYSGEPWYYTSGSSVTITPYPYDGYRVASMTVDGNPVTLTDGEYLCQVWIDHQIVVTFEEIPSYTISVNDYDSNGGYVSFSEWYQGDVPNFSDGTDVMMYVYPYSGYRTIVSVDGEEKELTYDADQKAYSYSFNGISENHTVNVTFEEVGTSSATVAYNNAQVQGVVVRVGSDNWSFSNEGMAYMTIGEKAFIHVQPAISYEVKSVFVDNMQLTADAEGDYEFTFPSYDCYIKVTMQKKVAPESVTLTIPNNGETTYCSEYDLDFSNLSGIKAYVASGFNPLTGKLVLTRVYEVPAGTGLLIKGTPGDNTIYTKSTQYMYANMLKGIAEETTIWPTERITSWCGNCEYMNYFLGDDGDFYQLPEEGEVLGAYKAYLMIPSAVVENNSLAKISTIFLDDEEEMNGIATGIGFIKAGEPKTSTTNDDVYNLQGQKVNSKTLKPGIYIKNGKKFMVK